MIVLGLDTSTLTSSFALVEDGAPARVIAAGTHDASRRNADLLVAIDELCRGAGVAPASLGAIAVGAGPGSFTGLRIGMATAKGVAFAAGIPLWAVSSLAALAHDAELELANAQLFAHVDGLIVGALDARRGELYAGCYRRGARVGDERVLAPGELATWTEGLAAGAPITYAGDALGVYRDVLAPLADRWTSVTTPSGAAVAAVALAGPREDVLTGGAPTYIRASEAEIKYPHGVPGALRKR